MDHAARCAFVHAQVACAMAEIAAMQAKNAQCEYEGVSAEYDAADFRAIENRYMIGHNTVIEYLRGD